MKTFWMSLLTCICLTTTPFALARGEEAAIVVGAIAGVIAADATTYSGWLALELPDWKLKETNSTIHLNHQCGITGEARLIGNNLNNYLYLAIQNDTQEKIWISPQDVKTVFDTGLERFPDELPSSEPVELSPGRKLIAALPYSAKSDFTGVDSLKISVPIEQGKNKICMYSDDINRDASIPHNLRTFRSASVLESTVGLGANFGRSGAMADLGGGATSVEFVVYGFPSVRHGFHLAFNLDYFTSSNATLMALNTGSSGIDPKLSITNFELGYTFRWLLKDYLNLLYDVGPGVAIIQYGRLGSNYREGSGKFAVTQRLSLDLRIFRVKYGYWRGDYWIGASLSDYWIPSGSIGATDTYGNNLNGLMRFKIGI